MDCDQKEEFEYEEDSASEESLNESTGNSDEESEEEEEDITTDDEDIQDEKKNDKTSLIASNPIVSQLELFDNLMEVRIKQQEMLLNINKLPQLSTYHTFKKKIGRPFSLSIKGARRCLEKNLRYLLELQEELMRVEKMTTSNKIMKPIKGNCDNNMGMDEEITSDEEIDDDVKKNKTIKGDDDIGSKGEEEEEEEEDDKDDDNDNDDDEDDDEDEEDTPETIKKISNLSYEELINNRHALLRKYRSQLLKELSEKVKLNQPGQSKQGDFKSLTIPINRQIDQVLENKDSLIERSQTKRLAYKVIGKEVDQVIKEEDPTGERCKTVVAKDAEIFDDYDFYVKMMTSLTNRKVSATRDMVEISRRWAELNTLKNRSLKKSLVDQKASKGRKTRYNVIKRLVGMPDVEFSTSIDDKECDAIFNQIFSQSEAESGQSWLFKPVNC